jgi:hypothetical protein
VTGAASDGTSNTMSLQAYEPVTLGIGTLGAEELIKAPEDLPEVGARVPDPAVPPGASPPRDGQSAKGQAWVDCHSDCSAVECKGACGQTMLECARNCSSDQDCSAVCWDERTTCSTVCDDAATVCHDACDAQYL